MIKIVNSDEGKPISLILKNKKSKIQTYKMSKLNVYYLYKRKLDKYTTHSKSKFYIFYVQ